jgi:choline dehydrogenase-like flavoprotein
VRANSNDGRLTALDASEPYDVCIVGSGFSGTVLGRTLAGRGARVLMLESGRDLTSWLTDPRIRSLARYEFSGDTDYPLSRTTSRLLGGNSNFWTGRCERFHPSDFEPHAYTPPENPWPIGYADLDPHYDQAEQLLRVRGGPRSSFSPPRKSPLPLPPSPDISVLKQLGARLGVTFEESATATPTKTLRIFNVRKELLPAFLASERCALVTGVSVTRLLMHCLIITSFGTLSRSIPDLLCNSKVTSYFL